MLGGLNFRTFAALVKQRITALGVYTTTEVDTAIASAKLTADRVSGVVKALTVANNASNPTYQVDVACDAILLDDGAGGYKLFSGVTKTLDITAVGANGRDAGTEAANTWYYLWLIGKTDGTCDGLISSSSSAPTLPSGYTYKGLVGAVRNDASSNLLNFRQRGGRVWYNGVTGTPYALSGSSTSWVLQSVSTYVPPNASAMWLHNSQVGGTYNGSGDLQVQFALGCASGEYAYTQTWEDWGTASQPASVGSHGLVSLPNISQQFYYRLYIGPGVGSSPVATVFPAGFELPICAS